MKTGTIPCLLSCENSVNFSKQLNLLNLTQEFKEKNYKIVGLLIEKILKTPIKRVILEAFKDISKDLSQAAKKIVKASYKFQKYRLKECITRLYLHAAIKKNLEAYESQANYKTKRSKYTLTNKSKRLAARQLEKLLGKMYLRIKLLKFQKNSYRITKKLSQSFTRAEKKSNISIKASTLSQTFIASSYSSSPKISTKYEDMKFSVKKIKYHHGFEKLWLVYRKIIKKSTENTLARYIGKWKSNLQKGKLNINLPTNKIGRSTHISQFSFRDKE